MCSRTLYMLFFIFFILLIFAIIIRITLNTESFTNNHFSNDTCCTESQIRDCETYGKSGVCNYYNNNSCICQDAF
jgi:hypothetical protein